ncbi:DEAD/DEAH box helicase [Ignavigranum ruoffiae]|uniref:DEAD/DEAH box helicase n=1 Tax=Ignavigranum ruoffiae TaxID=89093 RepID=UPI0024AE0A34|nr:SNF2-related protein [Ignavigranum ruoffiae]
MKFQKETLRHYLETIKKIKSHIDEIDQTNHIKNISEELRESYYRLIINQLPKSIKKIYQEKVADNYLPTVFPRILLEYSNPIQDKILLEISNLKQLQTQSTNFKDKYETTLERLESALRYIKNNQTNFIKRIFLSKTTKRKIKENQKFVEEDIHKIDQIQQEAFGISADPREISQLKADFLQNTEIYYQEIKSALNYDMNQNDRFIKFIEEILEPIQTQLNNFDKSHLENKILNIWTDLKNTGAKKEIQRLPLEYLKVDDNFLNLDSLYAKQVYNIKDLESFLEYNKLDNQLFEIEKDQIVLALARFKEKYFNDFYPKIDIKHPDQAEITLLKTINIIRIRGQIREELLSELEEKVKIIESLIKDILHLRANFYQEALLTEHEYGKTNQLRSSLYDNLVVVLKLAVDLPIIEKRDKEWLIEDFKINSAEYYAIIDQVTGTSESYRPNDIPNFIVDKVKEYHLDTTNFKASLRPYQEFGAKYALYFKKTLLGDQMGLGKTIQALATANHLLNNGKKHIITIIPLSVLANWEREINKWSNIPIFIFRGQKRSESLKQWINKGGILLTNFEQTHYLLKNANTFKVDLVIVDEAHYIKNPEAKRTKNTNQLAEKAEYNLFMSGTPLENRLNEMKQLISVLNPSVVQNIENQNLETNLKDFKTELSLVYLRRKRDEVLKELPEIEEITMWSQLSTMERDYYNEAVARGISGIADMRRAGFYGKDPKKSEKIQQIINICVEAKDNGDKIIIFSFFKTVLRDIQKHIVNPVIGMISGDITPLERQELIDKFTKAANGAVLLSQIEAGGVGLNIQTANVVILCEPQWKPSTEQQAIGRVYRMGQTKNVIVYRLLSLESIDESMMMLLGHKNELFKTYAHDSLVADAFAQNNQPAELSKSKLGEQLIKIEQERLRKQAG